MLLSQEASAQDLSEACRRRMLPRQPAHLRWCPWSEDILNVSKMTNVGKCHRYLWELTVHIGSYDVPGSLEGTELGRKLGSLSNRQLLLALPDVGGSEVGSVRDKEPRSK